MPNQVKVEDFEVFNLFRIALLKFAQIAGQALTGADSEIARTRSWLEGEQATFWQGQLRKRTEAVTQARDALRQKKLFKDSSGRIPSAVDEEKTLAKCLAAVQHAQEKIDAVRRALPKLEKAGELYRGGVSRLGGQITGDIPKAVALLDRLAGTLEEYVQIETPAGISPESAATSPYEESISRGGDAAPEPPPKMADTAPPADGDDADAGPDAAPSANPPETPARKEARDGADGQ